VNQEDAAEHLRVALGRRLATWRDAARETQRSLAAQLPFSRSTVANVETGRQQAPREFWRRVMTYSALAATCWPPTTV
jgi:transcriptional regulator with XRE-family HTH domain